MKNTLAVSLIVTKLILSTAWGEDCDKISEYHDTIQTLAQEISILEQKSEEILKKSHPKQNMRDIISDKNITGTDLLKEKENWQETAEKIQNEKSETIKDAILPFIGLVLTAAINHHLYKYPPSTDPVFSEELLRQVSGRTLSRVMAGFFFVFSAAQTSWLAYKYYGLSKDVEEVQEKIDILGSLADIEDLIKRRKRIITHYQIELDILTQSCSP